MIARRCLRSLKFGLMLAVLGACRHALGSPVALAPLRRSDPLPSERGNAVDAPPDWMHGVWMREWIKRGTVVSSPTLVRYLQANRDFGDVRIPSRPLMERARSFTDLSDADLAILARQQGFVGTTTVTGRQSTWHHELDYQPADMSADIGEVERVGRGGMYERALDGSYVEHWRSLSDGDGRFVTVRVSRGKRLDRMLIVSGDYFYYARNRTSDLPEGASLEALIATAHPSRTTLVQWLDCELSVGRIRGGRVPWEIEHSTLPWREGQRLEFAGEIRSDSLTGALAERKEATGRWSIVQRGLTRQDAAVLFPDVP